MNILDETWKNALVVADNFNIAMKGATCLEDKLRMEKQRKIFQDIARKCRIAHFEYQDALKFKENTQKCQECFSVTQK